MEPGRGPSLHRHAYPEVFIVADGEATFTVDGAEHVARGGQTVVVPAGAAHRFQNTGSRDARADEHPASGRDEDGVARGLSQGEAVPRRVQSAPVRRRRAATVAGAARGRAPLRDAPDLLASASLASSAPLLLAGLAARSRSTSSTSRSRVPHTSILGVARDRRRCRSAGRCSRRARRGRPGVAAGVVFGLDRGRLRGYLPRAARRQLRARTGVTSPASATSLGGLLLAASGHRRASAAPRRAPAAHRARLARRPRGRLARGRRSSSSSFGVMPFAGSNLITHAPRWEIQRVEARHPARGGPHRHGRRPQARRPGTCPRATARPC